MQQLLAKSISHIFSPIIAWPILTLVLVYGTGLTTDQQATVLVPVLLCDLVLPVVLLTLFKKLNLISDLEITKVSERRLYFIVIMALHLISVGLLWWFGNAVAAELRLLGWMIEIAGTIITFYWKISVHLAANSFMIAIIMVLFGWQWWPLLLILPVVAWARVVRKKHTVAQTLAGSILPLAITFGGTWLLGL
ncbi:MAG: PAP2 family protein [uncultured bacterium]|nr:MAG: PAP2 family protein [uncultured bacterium]